MQNGGTWNPLLSHSVRPLVEELLYTGKTEETVDSDVSIVFHVLLTWEPAIEQYARDWNSLYNIDGLICQTCLRWIISEATFCVWMVATTLWRPCSVKLLLDQIQLFKCCHKPRWIIPLKTSGILCVNNNRKRVVVIPFLRWFQTSFENTVFQSWNVLRFLTDICAEMFKKTIEIKLFAKLVNFVLILTLIITITQSIEG